MTSNRDAEARMDLSSRGTSLHIGLNRVDPSHYGTPMPLDASEYDARDMADIAREAGFQTRILLSEQAKHEAVASAIQQAASSVPPDGMFFITYSGHGGQLPDSTGDEADYADETWCLYDRQLLDDELFALWSGFAPGVRILVISDSCHSGSVLSRFGPAETRTDEGRPRRIRAMVSSQATAVYDANRKLYDAVRSKHPLGRAVSVRASVLLLAACQDWESAYDGTRNGTFTEALRDVWDWGRFRGNYLQFHERITKHDALDPRQHPNYLKIGTANADFDMQQVFAI